MMSLDMFDQRGPRMPTVVVVVGEERRHRRVVVVAGPEVPGEVAVVG